MGTVSLSFARPLHMQGVQDSRKMPPDGVPMTHGWSMHVKIPELTMDISYDGHEIRRRFTGTVTIGTIKKLVQESYIQVGGYGDKNKLEEMQVALLRGTKHIRKSETSTPTA